MSIPAEYILTSLGVGETGKQALFRHGFNNLNNYHSLTQFDTVRDLKHLKLRDVPVADQKLLGDLIYQLEGDPEGSILPHWDSDDVDEFIHTRVLNLPPWIPAGARPQVNINSPFMEEFQGMYPSHDEGFSRFFGYFDNLCSGDDFDRLTDDHGVRSVFDLADMESDLNQGNVHGVSDSCQYILGRAITWCRLNRVWLSSFNEAEHKVLMNQYLLHEDLMRKGIDVRRSE